MNKKATDPKTHASNWVKVLFTKKKVTKSVVNKIKQAGDFFH